MERVCSDKFHRARQRLIIRNFRPAGGEVDQLLSVLGVKHAVLGFVLCIVFMYFDACQIGGVSEHRLVNTVG